MSHKKFPELKPLFLERMQKLLTNKKDFENYLEIIKNEPINSIRCNTLKIQPDELIKRLKEKVWKIKQPFKEYPEIIIVESQLQPGELGRSLEHQLGYYYIQEISSMLPILALKPKPNETFLDLCSSPGSKTTQAASFMENTGTIIANEVNFGRIKILGSNLQKCGVTNVILTKKEGRELCKKLREEDIFFDKILVDAPCSGEGTIRSSPKTLIMWNIKMIKSLSKLQKALLSSAIEILNLNGEIVYSTCTHSPEENEEVVDYVLNKFKDEIKLEKISLPKELKCREGIINWGDNDNPLKKEVINNTKKFNPEIKKCIRIYPQDNDTEGFFISKFKKIKEINKNG
jgi:NOL1/NOP2/sun family putative RNA methylase